jgi:hypothetical protein
MLKHIRLQFEHVSTSRCQNLTEGRLQPVGPVVVVPDVAEDVIGRIDVRFEAFKRDADVASPLDPDTEDTTFPALITAGLTAWILEHGVNAEVFTLDDDWGGAGPSPSAAVPDAGAAGHELVPGRVGRPRRFRRAHRRRRGLVAGPAVLPGRRLARGLPAGRGTGRDRADPHRGDP